MRGTGTRYVQNCKLGCGIRGEWGGCCWCRSSATHEHDDAVMKWQRFGVVWQMHTRRTGGLEERNVFVER